MYRVHRFSTHSDATCLTALLLLDSSTCSSPSPSVLVAPEEREQEPELFLLRAEESADSEEEDEWQECAVSAALLTSRCKSWSLLNADVDWLTLHSPQRASKDDRAREALMAASQLTLWLEPWSYDSTNPRCIRYTRLTSRK